MTKAVHFPLPLPYSLNLGTRWITDEWPRLERRARRPGRRPLPDQTVSILA